MRAVGYVKGKPFDLALIEVAPGKYLSKIAAGIFKLMQAAAEKDGIKLHINSAFRFHQHQQRLWASYTAYRIKKKPELRKILMKRAKALGLKRKVETFLALPENKLPQKALTATPGYSPHQSGIAIDLNRAHDDFSNDGIANGLTDQWLNKNAIKFGWKRTVQSEPWHWEFVG